MAEDSRSSHHAWLTVSAAFVIVCLAIGAYVYLGRKPPVAAGQVLSLDIYPIHRVLSNGPATEGLAGQGETLDEVIVFADVTIENQTDIPIFPFDMWATLDLPDGQQRCTAASRSDFDKVFLAYPETRRLRKTPLPRDLTLQPGQKIEGMMVFHFDISKAQWEARSGMDLHVSMQHQNSLVMPVPKTMGG